MLQTWYHEFQVFSAFHECKPCGTQRNDGQAGLRAVLEDKFIAFCQPVDDEGTVYNKIIMADRLSGSFVLAVYVFDENNTNLSIQVQYSVESQANQRKLMTTP
ncbi:MAG: hypothetical protein GY816_23155 [Cytophagales bacterium]|nr:hypothetical protein [Cytophagales bacterium]